MSPKHAAFIAAYIANGGNAKEAAITAGFEPASAHVRGCRLLKRPEIQAELAKRQERVMARAEVTREEVIRGFARIAFADLRKLYDENGNLKKIGELDDETAMAVAGVDQEEIFEGRGNDRHKVGTVRKVKRFDAVRALEGLARINGMFKDNVTVNGDFADRLVRARERSRQARS